MFSANRIQQKRLWKILALFTVLLTAMTLVLYALKQNINLYLTPSEISKQAEELKNRKLFRLGGLVVAGSHIEGQDLKHEFVLTDGIDNVRVYYRGLLPDLFREKQGIVAEGHLDSHGSFIADNVLAKHDENYHPPGVPKEVVV